MIKYPVRKTLKTIEEGRRRYNSNNTYHVDLECDIEVPCIDGTSLCYRSERVCLQLYPSYDNNGNYKGTVICCNLRFGWDFRYHCYSLRKKIREYDWITVLEIFPRLTFRDKQKESLTGIIIRNYRIIRANFKLEVKYDDFGPKMALMVSNLQSITGKFSFNIVNNNLVPALDYEIYHNNSYFAAYRNAVKGDDLLAAFKDHDIALSMCEKYMDNYKGAVLG